MPSMTTLLARVPNPQTLTPAQFAALFQDFEYDGAAGRIDMTAFGDAAYACISHSNKSLDRIKAVKMIRDYCFLTASTYYPKLNVTIVLYQLLLRLMSPERVNQMAFGLCGPAHFTILLIKSKPKTYARITMDLLLHGQTRGDDGFEIKPDKYVTDYDPTDKIPQADWLVAATLRNAETPIPAGKEGEYEGTLGPDVFAYCQHAGYAEVIALTCYDYATDSLAHAVARYGYEQYQPEGAKALIPNLGNPFDPVTNICIAGVMLDTWRIMLKLNSAFISHTETTLTVGPGDDPAFIQSLQDQRRQHEKRMLLEKLETPRKVFQVVPASSANHWVLAKKINIAKDMISLQVYTWGTRYQTVEVPVKSFAKAYSGFVAARG